MNQKELQKKLNEGEISHLDYLKQLNDYDDYALWCRNHGVEENEATAEFYFDMTSESDYENAEVFMEIYQ